MSVCYHHVPDFSTEQRPLANLSSKCCDASFLWVPLLHQWPTLLPADNNNNSSAVSLDMPCCILLSIANDYQKRHLIESALWFHFGLYTCISFFMDRRVILTPWIGPSIHDKPTHTPTVVVCFIDLWTVVVFHETDCTEWSNFTSMYKEWA